MILLYLQCSDCGFGVYADMPTFVDTGMDLHCMVCRHDEFQIAASEVDE